MSRFIWQFELTNQRWTRQNNWQKDSYKWELRYFWPIKQIVKINLDESQLNWEKGVCKKHHDVYWLDQDKPLNIKQRRGKLVYKPIINKKNERIAYDKKVNVSMDELSQYNYMQIPIEKMAIQLVIQEKPKCVLELSKIKLQNKAFSSLCLESRCGNLLDDLHSHFQLPGKACSYSEFLSGLYS